MIKQYQSKHLFIRYNQETVQLVWNKKIHRKTIKCVKSRKLYYSGNAEGKNLKWRFLPHRPFYLSFPFLLKSSVDACPRSSEGKWQMPRQDFSLYSKNFNLKINYCGLPCFEKLFAQLFCCSFQNYLFQLFKLETILSVVSVDEDL